MGILDRLFGPKNPPSPQNYQPMAAHQASAPTAQAQSAPAGAEAPLPPGTSPEDAAAIKRYQYLLKTADPADIERTHAEAFAKLTPEQRQMVLKSISDTDPSEKPTSDSPEALARAATRMEMKRPGTLMPMFGGSMGGGGTGRAGGLGMGGIIGGALLGTIAGSVIGSAISHSLFDDNQFQAWDQGESFADGQGFDQQGFGDAAMGQEAGFGDSSGFGDDSFGGFGDDSFGGFGGDSFGGDSFGGDSF